VKYQEGETLGEMPRVGGNPWWETKVEIFSVMSRSRWSWIDGESVPFIDHTD
jgi:hypothetical protein